MTKMLSKIFRLQIIVPFIYEMYLLHYPTGWLHDTCPENLHTLLSIPFGDGSDILRQWTDTVDNLSLVPDTENWKMGKRNNSHTAFISAVFRHI